MGLVEHDKSFYFLRIILALASLGILAIILSTMDESSRPWVFVSLIPLMTGLVIENRRLNTKWWIIGGKTLIALLISLIAFSNITNNIDLNYEQRALFYSYAFAGAFAILSVFYHDKKAITNVSEGVTLIQSVALVYWMIDIQAFNVNTYFSAFLILIGGPFVIFSFTHAFSYIKHTRKSRLILSIWSSVILVVFALDFFYKLYSFDRLRNLDVDIVITMIFQYYLLGFALISILQNMDMMMTYIPNKHQRFDKSHMKEIRKVNRALVKRFSPSQVKISDSIVALAAVSTFFYLNFHFQYLNRYTAIWLVFWSVPLLIILKNKLVILIKKS